MSQSKSSSGSQARSKTLPVDLAAVFERHGRWIVGYVPEVPGVNAQERTLGAARRALRCALMELAALDPEAIPRR